MPGHYLGETRHSKTKAFFSGYSGLLPALVELSPDLSSPVVGRPVVTVRQAGPDIRCSVRRTLSTFFSDNSPLSVRFAVQFVFPVPWEARAGVSGLAGAKEQAGLSESSLTRARCSVLEPPDGPLTFLRRWAEVRAGAGHSPAARASWDSHAIRAPGPASRLSCSRTGWERRRSCGLPLGGEEITL